METIKQPVGLETRDLALNSRISGFDPRRGQNNVVVDSELQE